MDTGIKVFLGGLIAVAVVILGVAIYQEATEPDSGEITVKDHRSAWTQISCHGNPLICTTIYHPECWEVTYVNDGETGDACVGEDEYRKYEVGAWYPAGAR